jgi:NAD(P)-dependent dehydrogenase (short-subunit alcohol dehydrogenase family)
VVNNAGYDLAGAIEEISMDDMRAQFETNFFGAVKVMKDVIPIMRNQRNGKIVNITSWEEGLRFHVTPFTTELNLL